MSKIKFISIKHFFIFIFIFLFSYFLFWKMVTNIPNPFFNLFISNFPYWKIATYILIAKSSFIVIIYYYGNFINRSLFYLICNIFNNNSLIIPKII